MAIRLLLVFVAASMAAAGGEIPTAIWVIEQALQTAQRASEDGLQLRYRRRHVNTTAKPDHDGEVNRSVYRVYPFKGEPFYELVGLDGEPATNEDREREAELREKFRDRVGGRSGIAFNRALVERYRFVLEGRRSLGGRPTWIVAFEPLDEPPPVERTVDYALNHCSGRFWIDAEDFGLARIDFKLREPVSVWAGVLGSIDEFRGSFVQQRLEPGGWLPSSMNLRMAGRKLFTSLDQTVSLEWLDYRPIAEAGSADTMMESKEAQGDDERTGTGDFAGRSTLDGGDGAAGVWRTDYSGREDGDSGGARRLRLRRGDGVER